jgi:hypothetical protein
MRIVQSAKVFGWLVGWLVWDGSVGNLGVSRGSKWVSECFAMRGWVGMMASRVRRVNRVGLVI